ncbi:GNAT family N-acetyltransferase [Aureivirga sp. CE67]|uniref:GNAT family N-acetyltransferase n=1 Tax=Aureivirga sp. CE67 TaxID=1788983 RepID=UPI0018CA8324|nr:GNAT family N-acetyltransferase [Aureivirga sp. CE67]
MSIIITNASSKHLKFASSICKMMENASSVRGTGIAKREPHYIEKKMEEGKAIIAIDNDLAVGFCYIESWEDQEYVANSGLIIHPKYQKKGLAKAIKKAIFDLSKEKFPTAKLFGITTSLAVMKINSDLGYKPVTFSELTKDETFWNGCRSCKNYDILKRTNRTMCLCTGMICDLKTQHTKQHSNEGSNSLVEFNSIENLTNLNHEK